MTDIAPWGTQPETLSIPLRPGKGFDIINDITINRDQCIIDIGIIRLTTRVVEGIPMAKQEIHHGYGPNGQRLFHSLTNPGIIAWKWGNQQWEGLN